MPSPANRPPRDRDSSDASLGDAAGAPSESRGDSVPVRRPAERATVRELPHGARIVTGNAGDHALALQLIVQSRQDVAVEDYQSGLDAPGYRASDRLLVRRDNQLLAHVHLTSHTAWFDGVRMPLVRLEDFAALPEYRQAGYEQSLLDTAESIAAAEGGVVAVVHADRPDWFQQQGWSLLRGQGHTRANARTVLAHLDAQARARLRRRRSAVHIRTWRHFELDEVRQIYDQTASRWWGAMFRSEACWQWLVGRRAEDQVLVAESQRKEAATNGDGGQGAEGRIVGYAVVRGSCIVEMMTLPELPSARVELLAQACRDAIDRDHHSISLYTPAADSLHELLVTASGAWIGDKTTTGPRWLVKLLSPERWVERAYPLLRDAARATGAPRPLELGIAAGDQSYLLRLTRRSSRLEQVEELPAECAMCARPVFQSLLLGNLAVSAAIAGGQLRFARAETAETVAALFPPRLFWQSPLD